MANWTLASSLLGSGLMLVLLGVLVRHKLYHIFPPFFAYCVFVLCAIGVDTALGKHPVSFFVAHWLGQGVYVVLAFLAMLSVLRPYMNHAYIRHPWLRLLFFPFVAFLVFSCLWVAFVRPIDTTSVARFASAVYVFVILMSVAEVSLFIISWRAKASDFLYWREQVFAILLGFGVLSSINLLSYTALVLRLLHLRVAPDIESVFQLVPSGAFIGSTAIWLKEFWNPKDLQEPPDLGKMRDALRLMQEQLDADLKYVREIARRLGIKLAAAGPTVNNS